MNISFTQSIILFSIILFIDVLSLISNDDIINDYEEKPMIQWDRMQLGPSTMRHMWITPIQTYSLLTKKAESDIFNGRFNEKSLNLIALQLLDYYDSFVRKEGIETARTSSKDPFTTQDLFYRFQQQQDLQLKQCYHTTLQEFDDAGGEQRKQQVAAQCAMNINRPVVFDQLREIFVAGVHQYLNELYINPFEMEDKTRKSNFDSRMEVFAWCSIHCNGSMHTMHHHVDSSISGVLYIATPSSITSALNATDDSTSVSPGSGGDLIFYDPRGALPPFGRSLHVVPSPGDLVLFPSWLTHAVAPTNSKNPRISVSFNMNGEWSLTTDVNQGYVAE